MKRISTYLMIFLLFLGFSSLSQNQVLNPGFEDWTSGDPDDWAYNDQTMVLTENTSDVHGGASSCHVLFNSQEQANVNLIGNSFSVTEGEELTASVWCLDNDNAGRARLSILFDGASNYYGDDYSIDSPDWQELTFAYNVPAGATSAQLQIRFYDVSSNWIDECEIIIDDAFLGINNTSVSAPVIEPGSGSYVDPVNVTMTCSTSGATIYYTTDGSDPDDNDSEYTASFQVTTNTTVKAKAYKAGLTPSNVTTVEYDFPTTTQVGTIAALRAGAIAASYELTGEAILSFQQSFRNQKYIQDATAAILIDDNDGNITTSYSLYDGITGITGTLSEYGGMLQFIPISDPGAATSSGNTITPEVITLDDLGADFEDYEAELIKVEGAVFADGGATFEVGTAYALTDGSKASYNFRTTFYDADYIGETIPSAPQNLVMIPNSRTDGEFVSSRSLADMTPASSNPATKLDIIDINGGSPVYENQSFTVTVQAQDASGTPAVVASNVSVTLSVGTGSGTLGGTITGTINSGTTNVTISGVTYGPHENGVVLNVAGGGLTGGNSDAFDVLEVVIPDLIFTEVMYKAIPNTDTLEYIEIYNNGSSVINLEGYQMTQGVDHIFGFYNLAAGDYVLLAKRADMMQSVYGITNAIEWDNGGLSNGGEDIELQDASGTVVTFIEYSGSDPWPSTETGKSIRFCDYNQAQNVGENWSNSVEFITNYEGIDLYGTPGEGCGDAPLVANFEGDPTSIMAGETVDFTDLSTGDPTAWSWSFSGGTPASSTLENPSIVYNTPGTYDVTLTVTRGGETDTETKTAYITVGDPTQPPVADFEANMTTVFVGQTIDFTDLSTNDPTSWSWTFEGGTPASSTQQNPSISYNTAGTYDVTLFVENSAGDDEMVKSDYITVMAASVGDLVITEIMYNPPESGDDVLEFIEIYNNSDDEVNLLGYAFTAGIDHVFEDDALASGEYMVIAKDAAAMQTVFNVSTVQWTSGSLSNSGELILLVHPTGSTIDSVHYGNSAPWPSEANGDGASIAVCDPETENSVGDNWHASVNFITNDGVDYYCSPGTAPAPVANFVANITEFPGSGGAVEFTELSTCEATSFAWEFEGATPATSTEENPTVNYSTAGDFDVTLTVSNANGTHTLTMEEYIHVGVGVEEQYLAQIAIIPNPSTGLFKISNPSQHAMNITVYSILGEQILERTALSQDEIIDLSDQQDGVYLVQIVMNGERRSLRLIKQ